MMLIITCPNCNTDTSEGLNFCLNCDKQIKCLNRDCNKLIIAGKSFCFHCGQSIGALTTSQAPHTFIRRVTQQGKGYTEHTELSVTDQAVNVFAPLVMNELTSPVSKRPYYATKVESIQR